MKRWVQNPPSDNRVKLVLGIVAACLLLFALERFVGLPEWMQVSPHTYRWTPD
ncbi:MAG: hypothetical protein AAF922_05285 [Pseudomonadota bacterium]